MSTASVAIRFAFLVSCAGFAACSLPAYSECSGPDICNLAAGGVCSQASTGNRWCQYPAAQVECPSGARWSVQAGDGLAGVCVGGDDAGTAPTIDADLGPDADTTPDAPIEPDASEPDAPEPDAPVPDAGIPDAPPPPDAPPDAATSGPVMIAAFDKDWKPLVGTPVIASAPDGTLDSETTTNGAGIAMLNVPIGGMVTVANRVADVENFTTITGVKPFDILTTISLETTRRKGPLVGPLSLYVSGAYSGADGYTAASSCETGLTFMADPPTQVEGSVYRDCMDADRYVDAIALAYTTTATRQKSIGFTYFKAYDIPNGGNAYGTFPGWTTARDVDVTVKNVPVSAIRTDFDAEVVYRDAALRTDEETISTNLYRIGVPSGESSNVAIRIRLGLTFAPEGNQGSGVIIRPRFPVESTMPSVDASTAPPRIHGLVVSDTDLGRPRLSWQIDGELPASVIGGYITMKWASPGSGKPAVNWTLVIPPRNEARAPILPAVLAALIPRQPPLWQVMLGNTGARAPTYDAFRTWYIPYLDPKNPLFESLATSGDLFQ